MKNPISETFCMDCMEYMRTVPDGFFNLAVVDPPYEIAGASSRNSSHSGAGKLKNRVMNRNSAKFKSWDIRPPKEYFDELFRVSRNQIVLGGNYFPLPPTRCIVCWDKCQPWENFSQVEIAWTSFDRPAKLFRFDNRTSGKIHPCEKPVKLYAYLFNTFAEQGDKIFDSHLGSGSSRIAAYKLGLDFYSTEVDKEYFDAQEERFRRECLDEYKSASGRIYKEQKLFEDI